MCATSPRPPTSWPPRSTRSTARWRSRTPSPSKAVERGRPHQRGGQGTGRGGGAHRRRDQADHRHRRADQSAGAQRHHRGGARRRGRPRLCGGRRRGQGAGRPDRRATEEIAAQIAGMQRATTRSIEAIAAIEHTIREIGDDQRRDRGGGDRAGRRHAGNRAQRRDRRQAHASTPPTRSVWSATPPTTPAPAPARSRAVADDLGQVAAPHPRPGRPVLRAARAPKASRLERRRDVARQLARRDQHRVEADVANRRRPDARRARLRPPRRCARCWRGITDSAASSSVARAFTSTKTSSCRRARDDVDFADRAFPAPRQDAEALGDQQSGGAALRRNAELKARPAAPGAAPLWRPAPAFGAAARVIARHRRHPCASVERALIDLAARPAGRQRDLADRVLDRDARQRPAQQRRRHRRRRVASSAGGATTMTISPRVSAPSA